MAHPHFNVTDITGRTIITVQGGSGFQKNLENPTDVIFEVVILNKMKPGEKK